MPKSLLLSGIVFLVFISSPAVAQWQTNGVPLTTAFNDQQFQKMVADGNGGAIVVWEDQRSDSDIYARRVDAAGVLHWGLDGTAICAEVNYQSSPAVVSDGAGGAIVAWVDQRFSNNDIFAQRIDASGNLLWTSTGEELCSHPASQGAVAIASDGGGGAIVAWIDTRNEAGGDVYARRITGSGTLDWTPNGEPVSVVAGIQSNITIVSDGAGNAILAWQDRRSGGNDIYTQMISGSGINQWTPSGVALCTAASSQLRPRIARDGASGAIVVWEDQRSGTSVDVYAQRVDGTGAPLWTSQGIPVCTAGNNQHLPEIQTDSAGNAIVAWSDERNFSSPDIYAQRIDPAGTLMWTTDGLPVVTAGIQTSPSIDADGFGGAIVASRDLGGDTIFAQRVDSLGVTQWAGGGAVVCNAPNSQQEPVVVSDAIGGGIVSWMDLRGGTYYDVYVHRLGPSGQVPTHVRPGPTHAPSLVSRPNPFSHATSVEIVLEHEADVAIDVFNLAGQRVRAMLRRRMSAGSHLERFDGRDDSGVRLPSGVYFCRVQAGGETRTSKIVIVR